MDKHAEYCHCCGRSLPVAQMDPLSRLGVAICIHCLIMPVREAIITARDTVLREQRILSMTRTGRRAVRVADRVKAYAVTGKRCNSCHAYRPAADYHVNNQRGDGLQQACKPCMKTRATLIAQPGGQALWRTVRDAMRAKNAQIQAVAASAGLPQIAS